MKKPIFKLHTPFQPAGAQPEAIKQLASGRPGKSVLLGVTGSGKTFTLANVIAQQDKPVLILSPNKTLAAQLYEEFSLFFPENKVCYFVSYYDYYQPESYLPAQDIYIPKETKINSELDRLRIESTASIINRPDTIIIASVSAIYSLGNPWDYRNLTFKLKVGEDITRKSLIDTLIFTQYKRNEVNKESGTFQVQGNTVIVQLPYQKEAVRIELFGSTIDTIELIDKKNHVVLQSLDNILIFPAKHFVTTKEKREAAITLIKRDLELALATMENPIYKDRLKVRVGHDIEMLEQTGYCTSIENYSRYFDGRQPGEAPYCLLDFFKPEQSDAQANLLLIIDESHISVPQLGAMYKGDQSRKTSLIDFGFRLPSAADNRPLNFEEVERYFNDVIFVSATPAEYELTHNNQIVEQIVRPTGICDPQIFIHPRTGQLDNLITEIKKTTEEGFRTLVTVLTKRSAEDLAQFLEQKKIKVCYLHSDIKTPERTELLQKLRAGIFDALVGINLLREGLDLPEVALVAIIDADIEGFLRDTRSLIQTIGRAARNTQSKVLLYADTITKSMRKAIDETDRRRTVQLAYNEEHGITATTVQREVTKSISSMQKAIQEASKNKQSKNKRPKTKEETIKLVDTLKIEMQNAAENLDFEKAIDLREQILKIQKLI